MPNDWTDPPPQFRYILFHKTDPAANQYKFYYIAYLENLWGKNCVLRLYGRRGGSQRSRMTPVESLETAWPLIRQHIHRRLSHGYELIDNG